MDERVIILAQATDTSQSRTGAGEAAEHSATADTHATTGAGQGAEEHGGAFPPFDFSTFGSQILWLAITFGLLYYLMSKVALPRIATILEERNDRIADDLEEAERLKQETDEAIAAYEQSLTEARTTAHGIAQEARDGAKAEIAAEQARIDAGLDTKMKAAEAQIGKVRDSALADVDSIAQDATAAMIEVLADTRAGKKEIADAVSAALSEGNR
ncbi:MAG: F0F1 ATP synthase subunit B [Alphaproteobacteria bacterium]